MRKKDDLAPNRPWFSLAHRIPALLQIAGFSVKIYDNDQTSPKRSAEIYSGASLLTLELFDDKHGNIRQHGQFSCLNWFIFLRKHCCKYFWIMKVSRGTVSAADKKIHFSISVTQYEFKFQLIIVIFSIRKRLPVHSNWKYINTFTADMHTAQNKYCKHQEYTLIITSYWNL